MQQPTCDFWFDPSDVNLEIQGWIKPHATSLSRFGKSFVMFSQSESKFQYCHLCEEESRASVFSQLSGTLRDSFVRPLLDRHTLSLSK